MKAARLFEYGELPRVVDVPKPTLKEPDDVIIKVAGVGVCRTDLNLSSGFFKSVLPEGILPFTLGHENIGQVEECGTKSGNLKVGDAVILHPMISCGECLPCRMGNDTFCKAALNLGFDGTDGGYAEFLRTKTRNVVKISPREDLRSLAPLACAGLTAYHAVKRVSQHFRIGGYVAVIGVGGLGHYAVQLLNEMAPSEIFAIDIFPDKLRLALELGADKAFLSGESDSHIKEILDLTKGEGVDVVLDFVGSDQSTQMALKILRKRGIYSIVGYGGTLSAQTLQLIDNEFIIQGNLIGSYSELCELMGIVDKGKLHTEVEIYPLSQVADVFERFKQRKIVGRAVLDPSSSSTL